MLIYIPVSYETISASTGTPTMYSGTLPVWATRPMEVVITMDERHGVTLYLWRLTGSGAPVAEHALTLPYSSTPVTFDLSYASVLFPAYARNRSFDGDTYAIRIVSQYDGATIQIPVVNADMTYGQMQGVEEALPQPPKPRIPPISADLFVLGQPNTVYPCVATPVTGYQGNDVFPATITSGKTVDISNLKKLVIMDYPKPGGTYEVNYEDRLWDDAINDDSLWCALRIRWNMHNGQWYWGAFKSFFWNNKFTYLRGRGGVTEQAEITVNLEYTKEEYTVYQQLLTSSNIFAMLNIDGIMQHLQKEFRLDVVGDTGARWSGSDRVYRQQVKFRTTTLQDNYVPIGMPDLPPIEPAVITQIPETSTVSKGEQTFMYKVSSNVNAVIESYPDWCTPVSPEDGKIGVGITDVIFRASENTGEQRIGTIVIRQLGGDASASHTVSQLSVSGSLVITPNNIALPSSAEIMRARLVASEPWAMSFNDPWCSIAPTSGDAGTYNLIVSCIANTETPPAKRIGTIDIEGLASQESATIIITQSGKVTPFRFTPELPIILPPVNYDHTFALNAAQQWGSENYSPTIIKIKPETGDANPQEDFYLFVAKNHKDYPRMASFRLRARDSGDSILKGFIQGSSTGAPDAMVDPIRITGDDTRKAVVRLVSLGYWEISPIQYDWIQAFPMSGVEGCHDIIVSLDVNNTGSARTGGLYFTVNGTERTAVVLINQP
nr:MAG TPA: hypothetical protein [Caudoviricetes sp.]